MFVCLRMVAFVYLCCSIFGLLCFVLVCFVMFCFVLRYVVLLLLHFEFALFFVCVGVCVIVHIRV